MDKLLLILFIILTIVIILYLKNNPHVVKNKLNISNQEILKQNSNVMSLVGELSNIKNQNHLNDIKANIDNLSRYIKQIINIYFRTINENLRNPYFYKIIRTSESI